MKYSYLNIIKTDQAKVEQVLDEKVELFINIYEHLLNDELPSKYLNSIFPSQIFQEYPFSMLKKLVDTKQSPIHHPEGSAWNHTLLVVDEAAKRREKSKNKEVFMWAALLHDIGKPDTTRNRKGKITSYNHDNVGAVLTEEFLEYFACKDDFKEKVANLVRYHMHILYVLKDLSFGNVSSMKEKVDVDEVALLGLCDRLGRTNANEDEESENMKKFLLKVKK